MKKIFTLLFAVGVLTAVSHAQAGTRDNRDNPRYEQRSPQTNNQRDNGYNDDRDMSGYNDSYDNDVRYNRNNPSDRRSMEMQINRINRKYDLQVQRVRNDFSMRRFEKMRIIRSIEAQRQQEIRMLYARSNNHRGWKDDRGYSNRY